MTVELEEVGSVVEDPEVNKLLTLPHISDVFEDIEEVAGSVKPDGETQVDGDRINTGDEISNDNTDNDVKPGESNRNDDTVIDATDHIYDNRPIELPLVVMTVNRQISPVCYYQTNGISMEILKVLYSYPNFDKDGAGPFMHRRHGDTKVVTSTILGDILADRIVWSELHEGSTILHQLHEEWVPYIDIKFMNGDQQLTEDDAIERISRVGYHDVVIFDNDRNQGTMETEAYYSQYGEYKPNKKGLSPWQQFINIVGGAFDAYHASTGNNVGISTDIITSTSSVSAAAGSAGYAAVQKWFDKAIVEAAISSAVGDTKTPQTVTSYSFETSAAWGGVKVYTLSESGNKQFYGLYKDNEAALEDISSKQGVRKSPIKWTEVHHGV